MIHSRSGKFRGFVSDTNELIRKEASRTRARINVHRGFHSRYCREQRQALCHRERDPPSDVAFACRTPRTADTWVAGLMLSIHTSNTLLQTTGPGLSWQ
jgi:hypothetical protein